MFLISFLMAIVFFVFIVGVADMVENKELNRLSDKYDWWSACLVILSLLNGVF